MNHLTLELFALFAIRVPSYVSGLSIVADVADVADAPAEAGPLRSSIIINNNKQ